MICAVSHFVGFLSQNLVGLLPPDKLRGIRKVVEWVLWTWFNKQVIWTFAIVLQEWKEKDGKLLSASKCMP